MTRAAMLPICVGIGCMVIVTAALFRMTKHATPNHRADTHVGEFKEGASPTQIEVIELVKSIKARKHRYATDVLSDPEGKLLPFPRDSREAALALLEVCENCNSIDDLRAVSKVRRRMNADIGDEVIARIEAQVDPWRKYCLLGSVGRINRFRNVSRLLLQLDDRRVVRSPSPSDYAFNAQQEGNERVCNVALRGIAAQFSGMAEYERLPCFRFEEGNMERKIDDFRSFWQEHTDQILQDFTETERKGH